MTTPAADLRALYTTLVAAWESGDRARFFDAVKAFRDPAAALHPGHTSALWSGGMAMLYRDCAPEYIAEVEWYTPSRLECLGRVVEEEMTRRERMAAAA